MAAPTANYARACTNFNINFDGTFTAFDAATLVNGQNVYIQIAVNRSCRVIDALQISAVAALAGNNTVAKVVSGATTTLVTLVGTTAAGDIERAAAIGAGGAAYADGLVAAGNSLRYTAADSTARHLCALTLIGNSIP